MQKDRRCHLKVKNRKSISMFISYLRQQISQIKLYFDVFSCPSEPL